MSPDVAIEINSYTDSFADTIARADMYRERGSKYAVAMNPETRDVQERGTPPGDLVLDFDAIIEA